MLSILILLFGSISAFAQIPDPRDSIILESKTVAPGLTGDPAFTMKVFLTNKDTVFALTLVLETHTVAGTGYVLVDDNGSGVRGFGDVVTPLKGTLDRITYAGFAGYDENSPDSFIVFGSFYPTPMNQRARSEPSNLVRSAVWELRFKHSSDSSGLVKIDSARLQLETQVILNAIAVIVNHQFVDVPVNFAKSLITIPPGPKGDLNWDFELRPSDLVLLLNCVTSGETPPAGPSSCDINCDGQGSTADVVLMIRAVFLKEELPC